MKVKHLKILVLLLFIAGATLLVRFSSIGSYLTPDGIVNWIESFGALGPVIYIGLYSVAPSLMLPGLPLTIVGAVLFGPFWGIVYVAIGATLGAAIAFIIARLMGREWVAGVLKGPGMVRLAKIDSQVKLKGWKVVAVTRLIPIFPYNLLNYAFGLTSIKFAHYFIATFFCMLPGITAYVLFSSSALGLLRGELSTEFFLGLLAFVLLFALAFFYKRYNRRSVREQ